MRKPIVSGQFYPHSQAQCLTELQQCLSERTVKGHLPETIVGGIVPHAGWFFSGSLAAMVFSAIKKQNEIVDTFVIFGASHSYFGTPVVYEAGSWQSPLGEVAIDEEFAAAAVVEGPAASDSSAHSHEHSIEVQIPFIQHLFSDAKIVPILTPPLDDTIELGKRLGKIAKESDKRIVFIGSTDLTHYGPRYGFAPMGTGDKAIEWASKVNDGKFIAHALKLDAESVLETASQNHSACGAGAVAATIMAARQFNREQGVLLAHTNSNSVMAEKMATTSTESVGYAAIVY